MLFADKDDVVRSLGCRNYNLLVVNSGSAISWSVNTDVVFVLTDLLSFPDLNLKQRPNSFDPFWKDINLLFFLLCPFSGRVLNRVHRRYEVVCPIYELWVTIFWTFSKDLRKFHFLWSYYYFFISLCCFVPKQYCPVKTRNVCTDWHRISITIV